MKNVSVVIVNWNGKKDTSVCLDSLRNLRHRGVRLEVIVVDNGSSDGSAGHLSQAYPWVTLLLLDENLGFTGGNNTGIQYAYGKGADYVWLLNNDTIVDPDALTILDAFRDPKVGLAGSKIYFAAGHEYHRDRYAPAERGKVFWYAGGILDWNNMYASHRGVDEVDAGQYDAVEETPFITGCSMMIRRDVITKIGMFDDAFYLYLEDVDYSLRAKKAGYSLRYFPRSVIWHVNAGSSGGAGNPIHDYYITRNRLRVGLRYAPMRTKVALLREAVRFAVGDNPEKRKAVADFLTGRWGKRYEPKNH